MYINIQQGMLFNYSIFNLKYFCTFSIIKCYRYEMNNMKNVMIKEMHFCSIFSINLNYSE